MKIFFPKKSENDHFGAQGLIFRGDHNGIKSSVCTIEQLATTKKPLWWPSTFHNFDLDHSYSKSKFPTSQNLHSPKSSNNIFQKIIYITWKIKYFLCRLSNLCSLSIIVFSWHKAVHPLISIALWPHLWTASWRLSFQ